MPELILLIGIPGSGKSFYTKKYDYDRIFKHNTTILSSDEIRKQLYGDENDQTHNEEVFQYIKDTSVEKLEKGQRVIIDATNLSRKARQSITDYVDQKLSFYEYGFIKFVVVATPYYQCLENNRKRSRQVPENVIERMYKQFEFPTLSEAVHEIEVVYPFEIDKDFYGMKHPYENLMDFPHDTPYHKLTVGEHMKKTYEIMQLLTSDKVLLKAAELHDIGKPFCKEIMEEEGRARYYNHANVGSYEAMFYAKCAKFNKEETYQLINLIQFHMRAHDCVDNEKATQKLKLIVGEELYYKLQALRIADKEAH